MPTVPGYIIQIRVPPFSQKEQRCPCLILYLVALVSLPSRGFIAESSPLCSRPSTRSRNHDQWHNPASPLPRSIQQVVLQPVQLSPVTTGLHLSTPNRIPATPVEAPPPHPPPLMRLPFPIEWQFTQPTRFSIGFATSNSTATIAALAPLLFPMALATNTSMYHTRRLDETLAEPARNIAKPDRADRRKGEYKAGGRAGCRAR